MKKVFLLSILLLSSCLGGCSKVDYSSIPCIGDGTFYYYSRTFYGIFISKTEYYFKPNGTGYWQSSKKENGVIITEPKNKFTYTFLDEVNIKIVPSDGRETKTGYFSDSSNYHYFHIDGYTLSPSNVSVIQTY